MQHTLNCLPWSLVALRNGKSGHRSSEDGNSEELHVVGVIGWTSGIEIERRRYNSWEVELEVVDSVVEGMEERRVAGRNGGIYGH